MATPVCDICQDTGSNSVGQEVNKPSSALQDVLDECFKVQDDIDNLYEDCATEILKVKRKYNKLKQPYYKDREHFIQKVIIFRIKAKKVQNLRR